jgi:hypothetical protein
MADLVAAFKNDVDALLEKGNECEGVILEDFWEVNRFCYSLESILKEGLVSRCNLNLFKDSAHQSQKTKIAPLVFLLTNCL